VIVREKYTAAVVGAGNVAFSLIPALQKKDIIVENVVSRDEIKAKKMASRYETGFKILDNGLKLDSQMIFLTVSDDYIEDVAAKLNVADSQILIHTSGSTDLTILKQHAKHSGVLYPLQTFTNQRLIDISRVPTCVEASDLQTLNILQDVAALLSSKFMIMSSKQRKQLHLAAVFVSNFTNHMYDIAHWLLEKEKIDFSLMYPIIEETTEKIKHMNPGEAQTGPALRGNKKIMEVHKNMLKSDHELFDLYEALSKSIRDFR